jgi:transposase
LKNVVLSGAGGSFTTVLDRDTSWVARDHEYKRHGTLTLMAGIDLLTGHVHAIVKERHRSREFIEFLKLLDAAYPTDTAIEIILDNHSAHVSRETTSWLAAQPIGRFTCTFTPTHGSWLKSH